MNTLRNRMIGSAMVIAVGLPLLVGADRNARTDPAVMGKRVRQGNPVGFTNALLIQLRVADLDRAIAFYRDTLGFDLRLRNDELSWAKLYSPVDRVVIGLGESPDGKGSGSLTLNFSVDSVDKARGVLESRGVIFKGPTITISEVVKLADFTDPDGNAIRLAESLDPNVD